MDFRLKTRCEESMTADPRGLDSALDGQGGSLVFRDPVECTLLAP
jgi:hypothetical protein